MLSNLCVRATIKNTNEDAIFLKESTSSIIGCISDGCSTGINSSFASRLLCYLFEKEMFYPQLTNHFIENIIRELKDIAERLRLTEMNFLATFIPFIYIKEKKQLRIRPFGDGVYYINGEEFRLEQNNTPDYIGYQINEGFAGNSMYLDKYPELVYDNVDSFIICSDGIDSFSVSQFETIDKKEMFKLLEAPTSENYLQRQYNILKRKKFTNSDDVSIISYAKD
jgi:serine/threonine protein phosphatase PrpC